MSESRYHVRFKDGASGEVLGLMLTESPQLGFSRRLINPYAAKMGQGATEDSDLTEWSVVSQRDWRGGRGQEEMEDAAAFYEAWNLETRIEGQVTLGPLPQNPTGTLPRYEPGNVTWYSVAWAGPEVQAVATDGIESAIYSDHEAGQMFTVRSDNYFVASVEVRIKKEAATTENVRLCVYSDGGEGNRQPDVELAHKDVAAGSVGTDFGWVTFTLDSPLAVSRGVYWVVLKSSGTPMAHEYTWSLGEGDPYREGFSMWQGDGYSWRRLLPDWDGTFKVHWARISRAMSFVCPAGGISCTSVQVYVTLPRPQQTYVKLCADSGGVPGTVLKTKTVTPDQNGWYEVVWDSAQALTGDATYHVVVEPVAESNPPRWGGLQLWGGNAAGGYGSGAARRQLGSGSWDAQTEDLYFRVNRDELDGYAVGFARYEGKWYCGAGDTVYEWNEGGPSWSVSDAIADAEVTGIEVWGGYLWAARGSENILRRYNGASWADVSGVYGKLLRAGGGYLHRTDGQAGHEHEVYYTADGTNWSSAIAVGAGDHEVTGMAWYRDMLVCATAVRLWGVAAELAYPLLDWSSQEDADNGKGLVMWSRTGCLYIPLRYGLYRWNGDTMVAVGPEQGMGLPAERAGKIAALTGTSNWLFAAVDAGSGTSSVLAYNGMGGWHELQRAEKANQRVRALGFEVIHTPSRVWFGLGNETRYLMLPDKTDNPWQWEGYEFNAQGELETSWVGGELLEIVKDLHEVVVRGEGFGSTQPVNVYYEIDRSGQWTYLGEVSEGPRESLSFVASVFSSKTAGTGSTNTTIELASGSTTEDMAAGDWCRINDEVRQVASVTDSDTFVLEIGLADAPASGDVVYASRPAGREFRLKLALQTSDRTKTPKVEAVFVRYQNNVLDRFVYSLSIRVEDGMSDLGGNPYPHVAADLRVALDGWAKRHTPFMLYDPDGVGHTVKVTGVGEGGYKRGEGALPERYGSVYSMNLVEMA